MEKRVKKKDQIFQSQCDFGYNAEPQNLSANYMLMEFLQ